MSINSTHIGPQTQKYDLHWAIWSLRGRVEVFCAQGSYETWRKWWVVDGIIMTREIYCCSRHSKKFGAHTARDLEDSVDIKNLAQP